MVCGLVSVLLGSSCGGGEAEGSPPPSGPRLSAQLGRTVEGRLRQSVRDAELPGASAAIVFRDGREWSSAAGYAVLTPRQRMTPRTSLPFDSITKVVTAALALRLAELGRLALDDSVGRWYPAWRGDRRATVRDLLGHTAGVRDPELDVVERLIAGMPAQRERVVTAAEIIAASPKPGQRTTEARYSNVGYMIAGAVLERAAAEPLAGAMRRELFGQPGGDGLALQPAERPRVPRAHLYGDPEQVSGRNDVGDGGPILPSRAEATLSGPAGALAGDVPALARWAHALLGGRIVSRASLRQMTSFRPADFIDGYGLGLMCTSFAGRPMRGHVGRGIGSHTELWNLPRERLTIAITWNEGRRNDLGESGPLTTLLCATLGSAPQER